MMIQGGYSLFGNVALAALDAMRRAEFFEDISFAT